MRERERERERVGNRWIMCLLMQFNRSVRIINVTFQLLDILD